LVGLDFEVEDYKVYVSSIVIQGDFPNYENESIIPRQFNTKVTVDNQVLEKAIKKVLTFTKAENNFVEITFQED
jgi:DNA polymerase III sliding clamp (beta) subunit (PCNA family)